MLGQKRDPKLYEQLRHEYGLDRPWPAQYFNYIAGVLHGDLGKSYRYAGAGLYTHSTSQGCRCDAGVDPCLPSRPKPA